MMKIAIADLLTRANRNKNAAEVEEELRFHIEMLECKFTQDGMRAAEAKAAASRRFGDFERIRKQCVDISRRKSLLRRILKTFSILIAVSGFTIQLLSSDYKVARIGSTLIMIAIAGRLLLYVRGLGASAFLSQSKETSLSVLTETSDDSSKLREV